MKCSVCTLEDSTVKSRSVVGGGTEMKVVNEQLCDHCAGYFRDSRPEDDIRIPTVGGQHVQAAPQGPPKPDGWPSYAKWPMQLGDALPPGWINDSQGLRKVS